MSKLTAQQIELNKILSKHGFDFIDALEIEERVKEFDGDMDDVSEYLQERIYEQDIIYYGKAIEYLFEHDASLQASIELAQDYGYTLDKINSELLATLLYQHNLNEALSGLMEELSEKFEQAEEE